MSRKIIRLWLDDIRTAPDGFAWHTTTTTLKGAVIMGYERGYDLVMSLDHDLGESEPNGYQFCTWLEEKILADGWDADRFTINIHSMNPVGGINMRKALEHAHVPTILGLGNESLVVGVLNDY